MLAVGAVAARLPAVPGPPCPLRLLTGVPCPLCGSTTSVRTVLGGDPVAALAVSPVGVAAVIAAVVLLVWRPARVRVPWVVALVLLAGSWLYQLSRYGVF